MIFNDNIVVSRGIGLQVSIIITFSLRLRYYEKQNLIDVVTHGLTSDFQFILMIR